MSQLHSKRRKRLFELNKVSANRLCGKHYNPSSNDVPTQDGWSSYGWVIQQILCKKIQVWKTYKCIFESNVKSNQTTSSCTYIV